MSALRMIFIQEGDYMTLNEAKILLSENNIAFDVREFENETAYWCHVSMFPYTKNAKPCKVIALIIRSNNGRKDIELQFNAVDNDFHFEELWFGSYCFEIFDVNEEMLADDLLDRIKEIQSGNFIVIVANNLKKKTWLGDACFERNENDDAFGQSGFEKAMKRIRKPKGPISKLFRTQKQYEIYDWNTYQCIVK